MIIFPCRFHLVFMSITISESLLYLPPLEISHAFPFCFWFFRYKRKNIKYAMLSNITVDDFSLKFSHLNI